MKNDYVLILKVKSLTRNQATLLGAKCINTAKKISPGTRNIIAIEKKGEE